MHCPVWYAKLITPSSEFEKYRAYESVRFNEHEKEDWYFAALSQIVVKAAGGGDETKVRDFLLDFSKPEPMSAEAQHDLQQAIWEAAIGKKATFKKGGNNARGNKNSSS